MAKYIFTADDYGIIDAIDTGVCKAISEGWINSVEVFANDLEKLKVSVEKLGNIRLDKYAEAQGISESEAFINVGAHLTITSGTPLMNSGFFTRKGGEKEGMFRKWTNFERPVLADRIEETKQLKKELEAQIQALKTEVDKFEGTLKFNHLTSHHNSLYFFEDYARIYYELATEHGMAVRTPIGRPKLKDSLYYHQLNVRLWGNLDNDDRRHLMHFSRNRQAFLDRQEADQNLPKMTTYHNNIHYGPPPFVAMHPEKIVRKAKRKNKKLKECFAQYQVNDSVEFVFHLIDLNIAQLDQYVKQAKFSNSNYPGIEGTYFDGRMAEYLSLSHIMQEDESIAKQFVNWSDL